MSPCFTVKHTSMLGASSPILVDVIRKPIVAPKHKRVNRFESYNDNYKLTIIIINNNISSLRIKGYWKCFIY